MGEFRKTKLFRKLLILSENQIRMMESQLSKSKWQSPPTSRCLTKPGLPDRMQLNEGKDSIWDHQTSDRKTLQEQIECPLLSRIEPLNRKRAREEEPSMKGSSPGPERKIQKLIRSPPVRNPPESSSTTTWSTSKSPSIVATKDEVRVRTICACPDLFKIICQIRVDAVEQLLTHHPNLFFFFFFLE